MRDGIGPARRDPMPSATGRATIVGPGSTAIAATRATPRRRPPERSREFTRLVELRAYSIWDRSGRPTGPAGEAVKEKNWLEAERQIRDEVEARAYRIWQKQGRPTGAAGEAVREKNLRAAEVELLAETEARAAPPARFRRLAPLVRVAASRRWNARSEGTSHGS